MADITPDLLPGMYAAVKKATGNAISLSQEPMEEIDDTVNGNPRYSVYQVTDEDIRVFDPSEVPVFEKQIGGTGDFSDISTSDILEIQYPGARVVLNVALGSSDVVRVKTGKYKALGIVYGALTTKVSDKNIMKDITALGSDCKRNYPTIQEFSIGMDVFLNKMCAEIPTTDFLIQHYAGGSSGNDITFEMLDPGATHALELTVTDTDISVTLGYAAGAINSTNQQVLDLINSDPSVRRLKVFGQMLDEADRSALAVEFTKDNLAGGDDAENYSTLKGTKLFLQIYANTDDNIRWEGFAYISDISYNNSAPDDIVKLSLTLTQFGPLYFRSA
jgi:hypothetical protein